MCGGRGVVVVAVAAGRSLSKMQRPDNDSNDLTHATHQTVTHTHTHPHIHTYTIHNNNIQTINRDSTLFAMPETGIGLFPDVGVMSVLASLPGELGPWLALTGARLKGHELKEAGLATQYMPSAALGGLAARLRRLGPAAADAAAVAAALDAAEAEAAAAAATGAAARGGGGGGGGGGLAARRPLIDSLFAGSGGGGSGGGGSGSGGGRSVACVLRAVREARVGPADAEWLEETRRQLERCATVAHPFAPPPPPSAHTPHTHTRPKTTQTQRKAKHTQTQPTQTKTQHNAKTARRRSHWRSPGSTCGARAPRRCRSPRASSRTGPWSATAWPATRITTRACARGSSTRTGGRAGAIAAWRTCRPGSSRG